jgi:hypothetical protein
MGLTFYLHMRRDDEFAEDAAVTGATTEITNAEDEQEAPQNYATNTSDFGVLANVDEEEGDRYVGLSSTTVPAIELRQPNRCSNVFIV